LNQRQIESTNLAYMETKLKYQSALDHETHNSPMLNILF